MSIFHRIPYLKNQWVTVRYTNFMESYSMSEVEIQVITQQFAERKWEMIGIIRYGYFTMTNTPKLSTLHNCKSIWIMCTCCFIVKNSLVQILEQNLTYFDLYFFNWITFMFQFIFFSDLLKIKLYSLTQLSFLKK